MEGVLISLDVSLCISVSFLTDLTLAISLYVSLCVSTSLSACLSRSHYLYLALYLSLYVSRSLSVHISLCSSRNILLIRNGVGDAGTEDALSVSCQTITDSEICAGEMQARRRRSRISFPLALIIFCRIIANSEMCGVGDAGTEDVPVSCSVSLSLSLYASRSLSVYLPVCVDRVNTLLIRNGVGDAGTKKKIPHLAPSRSRYLLSNYLLILKCAGWGCRHRRRSHISLSRSVSPVKLSLIWKFSGGAKQARLHEWLALTIALFY